MDQEVNLKDKEDQLKEQEVFLKKIENLECLGLNPNDIRIILGLETGNIKLIKSLIDDEKISAVELKRLE